MSTSSSAVHNEFAMESNQFVALISLALNLAGLGLILRYSPEPEEPVKEGPLRLGANGVSSWIFRSGCGDPERLRALYDLGYRWGLALMGAGLILELVLVVS
jgi:hypothetical protein